MTGSLSNPAVDAVGVVGWTWWLLLVLRGVLWLMVADVVASLVGVAVADVVVGSAPAEVYT